MMFEGKQSSFRLKRQKYFGEVDLPSEWKKTDSRAIQCGSGLTGFNQIKIHSPNYRSITYYKNREKKEEKDLSVISSQRSLVKLKVYAVSFSRFPETNSRCLTGQLGIYWTIIEVFTIDLTWYTLDSVFSLSLLYLLRNSELSLQTLS